MHVVFPTPQPFPALCEGPHKRGSPIAATCPPVPNHLVKGDRAAELDALELVGVGTTAPDEDQIIDLSRIRIGQSESDEVAVEQGIVDQRRDVIVLPAVPAQGSALASGWCMGHRAAIAYGSRNPGGTVALGP